MKYFCFFPVLNRLDLMARAIDSVADTFEALVIVDIDLLARPPALGTRIQRLEKSRAGAGKNKAS